MTIDLTDQELRLLQRALTLAENECIFVPDDDEAAEALRLKIDSALLIGAMEETNDV